MKTIILLTLLMINPVIKANEIISPSKGITLAVIQNSRQVHALLVLADTGDHIKAIDISKHFGVTGGIIEQYQKVGYEKLRQLAIEQNGKVTSYSIKQLLSPAGEGAHHLALGLNYAKHAKEVNDEAKPFMFVKATVATRAQPISVDMSELLDYEVELCARPLQTLTTVPAVDEPAFGFFICGDFTDRAKLLRGIDTENLQSGQGFSYAKSKANYFPTGPYMVISKHWQKFIADTQLSLILNGELKQQEKAEKLLWPLNTIIEKALHHSRHNTAGDSEIVASLLPAGKISPKITILTGTPEGILVKPPETSFKVISAFNYILTGKFTDSSLINYVIERYIAKLMTEKSTLQPNDQLLLKANYLGEIKITIVGDD